MAWDFFPSQLAGSCFVLRQARIFERPKSGGPLRTIGGSGEVGMDAFCHGNLRGPGTQGHVSPQEIAGPNSRPYSRKPMDNRPLIRPAISWEFYVALGVSTP